MSQRSRSSIRTARGPDGILTYLIETPPEALPPVRSAELDDAWRVAHAAASDAQWGSPRLFRFLGDEGPLDLALTDDDACCWAEALDRRAGLNTAYGMSMCLRLLALIDLIARAPWLKRFCRLSRAGATIEPALLRVAATAPLSAQGRFDERLIQDRLRHAAPLLASPDLSSGVLC